MYMFIKCLQPNVVYHKGRSGKKKKKKNQKKTTERSRRKRKKKEVEEEEEDEEEEERKREIRIRNIKFYSFRPLSLMKGCR